MTHCVGHRNGHRFPGTGRDERGRAGMRTSTLVYGRGRAGTIRDARGRLQHGSGPQGRGFDSLQAHHPFELTPTTLTITNPRITPPMWQQRGSNGRIGKPSPGENWHPPAPPSNSPVDKAEVAQRQHVDAPFVHLELPVTGQGRLRTDSLASRFEHRRRIQVGL
jgi:hypothetical protein